MEQIASGAEEAASAAQETLAVATNTAATLVQARDRAEGARRRTEAVEIASGRDVEPDRNLGRQYQAQWRPAGRHRRHHGATERAGGEHRRCHQDRQPGFRPDQFAGAECGDRGGACRRPRPRFRSRRRRSSGTGRDLGKKRAGRAKPRRANRNPGRLDGVDHQDGGETAMDEAQKSQTVILALGELRREVGALAEGSQSIAVATLEAEISRSRGAKRRRDHFRCGRRAGCCGGGSASQRRTAGQRAGREPGRIPIPVRTCHRPQIGFDQRAISSPPRPSSSPLLFRKCRDRPRRS